MYNSEVAQNHKMAVPLNAKTPDTINLHRRLDLDYLKAIAIMLVVLGHIWNRSSPDWSTKLKFLIYNFHMPLFMYLSGFAFYLAFERKKNAHFRAYLVDRANRLLIPFIVMFVLTLNIKYLSRSLTEMRRSEFGYLEGYKYILFDTERGPAIDLWYLITLFMFSVLTYVIIKKNVKLLYFCLFISLMMHIYYAYGILIGLVSNDFYIARFCWFYLFFILGCIVSFHWFVLERIFIKYWFAAGITFLLFEYLSQFFSREWGEFRYLFAGILSIVAFHGAILSYGPAADSSIGFALNIISRNTMVIYLTNTIIIGALMSFGEKIINVSDYMIFYYILLTPIGILLPIIIREAMVACGYFPKLVKYIN